MTRSSTVRGAHPHVAALALAFFGICAVPALAQGKPAAETTIHLAGAGPARFEMTGTAPHFGKYACVGELALRPGATAGTMAGAGVAVLVAANGDRIVGVVECVVDANGVGQIHFSWRDAVEFSDGTTAVNTGRFARHRPPGVVIAIIAILIG